MLEKPHLFWLFQLRRAGEGTSWEGKRPAGVGGYLVPGWKSAKPCLPLQQFRLPCFAGKHLITRVIESISISYLVFSQNNDFNIKVDHI